MNVHFFTAVAASFMNTVVLTSVLSAGNHALFAGTRVLYGTYTNNMTWAEHSFVWLGLATAVPPQAPKIFARTTSRGIPLPALLLTSSISALCFGSSFIGSGELWGWLQNLVGVSNQVRLSHCFFYTDSEC
jgi:AAT family amino acid transporter